MNPRRLLAVVSTMILLVLLAGGSVAWAYFTATDSTDSQSATAATLAAASDGNAGSPDTATLNLSWAASSNLPASGGYYKVLRSLAESTTSSTVDVSTLTGSSTLGVSNASSFSNSPATIEVATSTGGAMLSFTSFSGTTFNGVSLISGSGTLSGVVIQGTQITTAGNACDHPTTNSCQDSGLNPGTTYWYAVQSADQNWSSPPTMPFSGASSTGPSINGVRVVSSSRVIAVGENCGIYFGSTTGNWTEETKPSGCAANLTGITLASDGKSGFIVGSGGTILLCSTSASNGCASASSTWSPLQSGKGPTTSTTLTGVSELSANSVVAVGNNGTSAEIWACSASCSSASTSWSKTNTLSSTSLQGVTLDANNVGWAVGSSGSNGLVELCSNGCNTTSPTWGAVTGHFPTIAPLNAVSFGADSNHVIAVGNGVIVECSASCATTGATWSTETYGGTGQISSSAVLTDVSTNGANSPVVVVGQGGVIGTCSAASCITSGSIAWTSQASNTSVNLHGVDLTASFAPAVAVGANGDITTATSATSWLSPATALGTYTASHSSGTTVTVSTGSGFGATSAVKLVFNGAVLTTSPSTITTSAAGAFSSFTFQTPTTLSAGTYEVLVSDSKGDATTFAFVLS